MEQQSNASHMNGRLLCRGFSFLNCVRGARAGTCPLGARREACRRRIGCVAMATVHPLDQAEAKVSTDVDVDSIRRQIESLQVGPVIWHQLGRRFGRLSLLRRADGTKEKGGRHRSGALLPLVWQDIDKRCPGTPVGGRPPGKKKSWYEVQGKPLRHTFICMTAGRQVLADRRLDQDGPGGRGRRICFPGGQRRHILQQSAGWRSGPQVCGKGMINCQITAVLQVVVQKDVAEAHDAQGLKLLTPTGTCVLIEGDLTETPEGTKQVW